MFVVDMKYSSLEKCIDDAQIKSDELFSILKLVRDQPPRKKTRVKDIKPVIFARLNSWLGKATPVTLKCQLDTGAPGSLVTKKFQRKYALRRLQGTRLFGRRLAETYKLPISVNALLHSLNSFTIV